MRRAALVVIVAGCGRIGFSPELVAVSEPDALATCTYGLAAADGGYALAWLEHPPAEAPLRMRFARVFGERVELTPQALASSLTSASYRVEVGAVPAGHVAFLGGSNLLRAVAIDASGQLAGVAEDTSGIDYNRFDIVETASGLSVFYDAGNRVYHRPLDAAGAVIGTATRVDLLETTQIAPRAVWTGDGFLVVWRDYVTGYRIRIARLAADGTPQPSIALDDQGTPQDGPRIGASGPGTFAVMWHEDERVYAVDVGADGVPLGARREIVGESNRAESFTYDGGGGAAGAAFAWESDTDTILPRIKVRSVAPDAPVRALGDPRYLYLCPAVTGGPDGLAVAARGWVEGQARVYLQELAE